MKALYCPGPSYFDEPLKQYAGWWHILEYQRKAIEQICNSLEVIAPTSAMIQSPAIAKYITYSLPSMRQAEKADLIVGAAAYGFVAFLAGSQAKRVAYVWNNEEGYRRRVLEPEYQMFNRGYDHSEAGGIINSHIFHLSNQVIACSPWVKKTHAEVVSPSKISIAFWGVDSQRFTPAKVEPPGFRILFLGGDPIRKGLRYLVQAFAQLQGAAELWIAGTDVKVELDQPEKVVRVLGPVPNKDVPELMQQCHVICIVTLEDGIALAIQEGMASGLVPIGTPDVAEVFQDNVSGFRVPFRDSATILARLQFLKDNPKSREKMARSARALAEQQTWEKFTTEFALILEKVLHGGELPHESYMPWLRETNG